MASDEGLSRDESRQMRDIGRQAMSQVVGVALKQAVSHDLLRTFAVVSKVNGDGTVDLECGSEETPMPLNGVRLTLGCSTVEVGDTVVVDTYDHSPLVVSVLYSNASSGHTVASKPEVNAAKSAADQALSEAKTAKAASDAAQESAASAKESADAATESAKTAQAKAEDATESAATAGRAAANAQAAAEAAQGDIYSQQTYFWHDSDGSHVLGEKDGYRSDVRADGLHVLSAKDSSELAKFTASGSQLGADNKAHQSMDYHSWRLVDADGVEFAHVSDLRDENGELEFVQSESVSVGDYTKLIENYPSRFVSVRLLSSDGGTVVGDVEYTTTNATGMKYYGTDHPYVFLHVTEQAMLDAGAVKGSGYVLEIDYMSNSDLYKAYTFGTRDTTAGNRIGSSSFSAGLGNVSEDKVSFSAGIGCHAGGMASVAMGALTAALSPFQVALGAANVVDEQNSYLLIVGNGIGNPNEVQEGMRMTVRRSNAMALRWSGTLELSGGVEARGDITTTGSSTVGNSTVKGNQDVSGSSTVAGRLTAGTAKVGDGSGTALNVVGGSLLSGNLSVTGDTTLNGSVTATGNATFGIAKVGVLTAGSATLGTPLPVASGGTGANTASAARANLFAAELISSDFNTYNATGIYQYQGGSKDNRPTDNWGVLIVSRSIVGSVVRISQVYYADINNDVFSRTATGTSLDALTWTGWSRLVRTDEMGGYAKAAGTGITNAWVGIWNGNTSDPGYRLETCWFVNGVQRGLCVDTYNRLRFYGANVNNWSLGNLSGDKDMIPVYRLYNQYNSQHLFVSSKSEYNSLVSQGWTGEGIVFYAFR